MTHRNESKIAALLADWQIAKEDGRAVTPEQLCHENGCPEVTDALRVQIALLSRSDWMFPASTPWLSDENGNSLTLDRYEIICKIGEGGMGTVYRARHKAMRREVALKTISDGSISPKQLQRFQREIRNVASLNHVGIVTAYDALEFEGRWYLVMELVDGENLRQVVDRRGALPWEEVCDILIQTSESIAAAHEIGITHRDIKPSNILLTGDGKTKLLDLGVSNVRTPNPDAGDQSTHASALDLTDTNVPVGTLSFMAPEQALDAQSADARSDIYSLGCTAYYLLSGQVLFPSDSVVATIVGHRETDVTPVVGKLDISRDIKTMLAKMLAKSPDDRFQTMAEVTEALRDARTGKSSAAAWALQGPRSAAAAPNRMSPGALTSIIASAVLLVSAATIFIYPKFGSLADSGSTATEITGTSTSNGSDRVANFARWVFNQQGELEIEDEFGLQTVDQVDGLPDAPFQVRGVFLADLLPSLSLGIFQTLGDLQSLELVACEIDNEDSTDLSRLRSLRSVYLDQCEIAAGTFEMFTTIPSLEELRVVDCPLPEGEQLELQPMPGLQSLQLNGLPVVDRHVKQLGKMPNLISLDLSSTQIRTSAFELCDGRTDVESLDISSTPITDKDFEGYSIPGLRNLYLGELRLGSNAIKFILGSPELEYLYLQKNDLAANMLTELAKCPSLVWLSLNEIPLTVREIEKLNGLVNLKSLDVSHCELSDEKLAHLQIGHLNALFVTGNPITDAFLDSLEAGSLEQLDITDCNISKDAKRRFRRRYPSCELLTGTAFIY